MADPDPAPSGTNREGEAHEATIKTWRINRWMIAVAVFAALCTAVGLIIATPDPPAEGVAQGDSGVNSGGTGNSPSQCGVVGAGASCQILEQARSHPEQAADADDTGVRAELRARPEANRPPAEPGPWAYAVVDTGALGLFARTTPTIEAARVGNAGNLDIVWADCVATSDFTPQALKETNNVGPKWVKAHWRHLDAGITRGLSERDQPTTAYFYLGFLEPLGHNGDIPAC
ncbi:hypothetical protein [Actinokineospora diospyrosa]|uniref:Uncharacterized protein n=1 Tax=Actinokineospora diospyrosa TaxID=103728 RepID=A0ABT1IBU3_9PSEU|nr:hypothetical protein [Actinokineospora diospyrosa]MCP2270036.1 hypothetical protein [Actinokineospora diospyrosa]